MSLLAKALRRRGRGIHCARLTGSLEIESSANPYSLAASIFEIVSEVVKIGNALYFKSIYWREKKKDGGAHDVVLHHLNILTKPQFLLLGHLSDKSDVSDNSESDNEKRSSKRSSDFSSAHIEAQEVLVQACWIHRGKKRSLIMSLDANGEIFGDLAAVFEEWDSYDIELMLSDYSTSYEFEPEQTIVTMPISVVKEESLVLDEDSDTDFASVSEFSPGTPAETPPLRFKTPIPEVPIVISPPQEAIINEELKGIKPALLVLNRVELKSLRDYLPETVRSESSYFALPDEPLRVSELQDRDLKAFFYVSLPLKDHSYFPSRPDTRMKLFVRVLYVQRVLYFLEMLWDVEEVNGGIADLKPSHLNIIDPPVVMPNDSDVQPTPTLALIQACWLEDGAKVSRFFDLRSDGEFMARDRGHQGWSTQHVLDPVRNFNPRFSSDWDELDDDYDYGS